MAPRVAQNVVHGVHAGFLLLALVMSTVTAGMFSGLQHRVIADAYEISGSTSTMRTTGRSFPRAVDIDENGSSVFVQTVRGEMTEMPLTDLSSLVEITDASDYQYAGDGVSVWFRQRRRTQRQKRPKRPTKPSSRPPSCPPMTRKRAIGSMPGWLPTLIAPTRRSSTETARTATPSDCSLPQWVTT
ncbi:MAG: hypothetical protein ACLSVD_06450 [Eggerthellaceae bacterium]